MPQNVPPGVLPPAQPVTPPPAIPTTAPKEVPKYAGPVRIQIFSELIATGSESAKIIDDKKRETIESVLNRVTGVKSVAFRPADRMFEAVFEGKYEDLAAFKPAMASTGVPSEMVSPLEIVFRPGSLPVQNPDKLKETLGKVPGVKAVVQDGNAFKCYADVETDLAAIESAGGSVMSHEWLSLAVSAVPDNAETAVTDLANTKYVLRVEVEDAQVKVLCVKGRVTKALLKSILTKNGFKVK
jgi:copper chaperone CopZ